MAAELRLSVTLHSYQVDIIRRGNHQGLSGY